MHHSTHRLDGAVILATPLSTRLLSLLSVAVLAAVIVFLASATFARKTSVPGYLVPDMGLIRVTAKASGVVERMHVREGEIVRAGQVLAALSLAAQTQAGDVGEAIVRSLHAEVDAVRQRAGVRLAQLRVQQAQDSELLAKSRGESAEARLEVSFQQERVELLRQELARGEALQRKGLLARRDLEGRRASMLAAQQELAAQRRQISAIEREIATLSARLAAAPLEMEAARSDAAVAEALLRQRIAESEARSEETVRATRAGRIAVLPVGASQSIAAQDLVAVIVPEGGRLEAELLAPSRAIGFVQPGQAVALSLEAFPYQRFGTVAGTIRSVSATVIAPRDVNLPGLTLQEPVFRIRVALASDSVRAYGKPIPMQPGMLVSAEIVFDRRSLMEWLFDPLYAVAGKA